MASAMHGAIQGNCWLVNTLGQENGFYKADQLLEHSLGKEKRLGSPPHTRSWEAHKKKLMAIPVLGKIVQHMEGKVFEFKCTRVHKE
ncbi:hypothetical protein FRC12_021106, partial [Ceratobasidium sp. 428]